MSSLRNPMPEQPAQIRRNNFAEVALGYTDELAIAEASRCLQCKHAPCRQGCPVGVDIPDFIKALRQGQTDQAAAIIKQKNNLPAVCGRVCPQENQCEKVCVLARKGQPVAIGRLERYAADHGSNLMPELQSESNSMPKIAIIGAGPAGLTAAGDLAGLGYQVTVFEALHEPGGVLMYGIPEFRLPKAIVRQEIEQLKLRGVKICVNEIAGKTFTIDELFTNDNFAAVFIGTGAGLPHFMNIPGENLNGVYSANEFLTRVNLMKAYQFPKTKTPVHLGKNVAVVGAGNVAMDSARTALRLGAENVYIVYRRSEAEIPARTEEFEHAKEEGVNLHLLTAPVEIIGNNNGWVESLKCVKMELGEPDESGRRRPIIKADSEFILPVDTVIMAIGQGPNPLVQHTTPGLNVNKNGNIIATEDGFTSKDGVFAGGDIVTGAATVILAMGAGKKAAAAIDEYIRQNQQQA